MNDSRAPTVERLRYLTTFALHAALAGQLRMLRRPARAQMRADSVLHAVFLSAYPTGHYGTVSRFGRWVPHLERRGCRVEILTPCSDAEWAAYGHGDAAADQRYYNACMRNCLDNVRRAADADAVVLHRGLLPFSPWQRPTFETQLARVNPHLVYDFYDAIWIQRQEASSQPSRIGRWLHPADKIENLIGLARVVTVANEQLAGFAREHHADVRLMPMLIDPDEFVPRSPVSGRPVVLGWLGNRYQIPRLLSLAPALRRVAAGRDVVVRVVTSERVEIPGVRVDSQTHAWSQETEREDLAGIDIGLLPLEDSLHDRGKSPLKLLQYSAAGVPTVATPVAVDTAVMKPGECFLPASDEQEWVDQLSALVDDAELRRRVGSLARETVREHYGFERHAPAFLDALRTAAA